MTLDGKNLLCALIEAIDKGMQINNFEISAPIRVPDYTCVVSMSFEVAPKDFEDIIESSMKGLFDFLKQAK